MSLFGIFNRSRAGRAQVDAGSNTSLPQVDSRNHGPVPKTASSLPLLGADRSAQLRTTTLVRETVHPSQRFSPVNDDFDETQPLPFRDIFHLCVRIAPAYTCPAAKPNTTTKQSNADELALEKTPTIPNSGLQRKIFALTKNGYVLQYADRGPTGRLPERMQKLTTDTIAIASDLVPGQAYTVLITESTNLDSFYQPDQTSILTKLGIKSGTNRRCIPSTLIVLGSSTQLDEWLTSVRKEVQRLLKPDSPALEALPSFKTIPTPRRGPRSMQQGPPIPTRITAPNDNRITANKKPHIADLSLSQSPLKKATTSPDLPSVASRPNGEHIIGQVSSSRRQGSDSSIAPTLTSRPVTPAGRSQGPTYQSRLRSPDHDTARIRKDSLTGQLGPRLVYREADGTTKVRKRASHYCQPETSERPPLRSVSSLSRLNTSQGPQRTFEPSPTLIEDVFPAPPSQESTPVERDEYHDFQQSLSAGVESGEEKDEYHAFQQSLSGSPNQSKRSRSTPRQITTGTNNISPPRSMRRGRWDSGPMPSEPPRPPSSASTARTSIKSPTGTRRAIFDRLIAGPPRDTPEYRPSSRATTIRTLREPQSSAISTRRAQSSGPSRPVSVLSATRSDQTLKARARLGLPQQLPLERDEDSDSEDDILVIQTNVEPPNHMAGWPKPPSSPARLPRPDFGLPVVALSPPMPPPDTPLPKPPGAWSR